MPSPDASRRNLQEARARWRPPERSEGIKQLVWEWHISTAPKESGRALARRLGVSHTYVRKLVRKFLRKPSPRSHSDHDSRAHGGSIKNVTVQPMIPDYFKAPKSCIDGLNAKEFSDEGKSQHVNPGTPGVFSVVINFPPSCSGGEWYFLGEVTFKGRDDADQPYEQSDLIRIKAT